MTMTYATLIQLQTIKDSRGSLSVIETNTHIPFSIQRVFYVYDVLEESTRGGHAHKKNEQLHICLFGSVTFVVEYDGKKEEITLKTPDTGLHMSPLVWHTMKNFTPGTILLVLNSESYDEKEYYRHYQEFLAAESAQRHSHNT